MTYPMTTHQAIEARGILPPPDLPRGHILRAKDIHTQRRRHVAMQAEMLAANGAGVLEIQETLNCARQTVFAMAKRLGFKIPGVGVCRPYTSKEKRMSTPVAAPSAAPSAGAMKAQAQMFRLLDEHFDADKGSYAADWNDERVAKACALAPAMVREFRRAGFGEPKTSPEIEQLRTDMATAKKLFADEMAGFEARLRKLEGGK